MLEMSRCGSKTWGWASRLYALTVLMEKFVAVRTLDLLTRFIHGYKLSPSAVTISLPIPYMTKWQQYPYIIILEYIISNYKWLRTPTSCLLIKQNTNISESQQKCYGMNKSTRTFWAALISSMLYKNTIISQLIVYKMTSRHYKPHHNRGIPCRGVNPSDSQCLIPHWIVNLFHKREIADLVTAAMTVIMYFEGFLQI